MNSIAGTSTQRDSSIGTDRRGVYNDTNHGTELLKEIISMENEDAYEKFEETSNYIRKKMTKLTAQYKPSPYGHKGLVSLTQTENRIIKEDTKINVCNVKETNNYFDDILNQANALEWAGISFNKKEWYKIRIAMKKMLLENNCENIRFFGKIFGIDSDYYILQGVGKEFPMKNPPVHTETRGNEGINRYTFWVSNSVLESWYELPDVTHEQIVTSRLFKYIFTGDGNAKVKSYIPFPGKEMHLLKCQIIRILHSSSIVPKNYLKLSENFKDQLEGKITEYDEEYKPLSFEEMKSPELENWIHEHAYIYPNGKVIDPSIETQVERMKGVNEDEGYKVKELEEGQEEPTEVDMKFWKIRIVGDQMVYNNANGEGFSHATIGIQNSRWPGTSCVWNNGTYCNIYIGFGFKNIGECYHPTQLGKVDKDPEEIREQPEPTPLKEPAEKPEPDTDEEKDPNAEGGEAN